MSGEPTVYVVDDDQAVRDSLQFLLDSAGLRTRAYETASAFLAECEPGRPLHGCVVVDLRLPGLSGIELQEELRRRGIRVPTIMITGHGDVPAAVRAMKAGALDFIEKPFNDRQLLDRIREAVSEDDRHRAFRARREEVLYRISLLTHRERQVMELVVQGKLNKQIAKELNLSHKTVEVHRAHVMEKMHATSLAQLVRYSVMMEDLGLTDGLLS